MNFRLKINALSAVQASRYGLHSVLGGIGGTALLVCANAFAVPGDAPNNSNAAVRNSTQAAPKMAIVSTTRPTNAPRQPTLAANQGFAALLPQAQPAAANAPVLVASAQTIYKLVDAQGRTTYANSPMTGAQKVALPDLTIMDSQWPSALAAANAAPANTTATPLPAPINETANPPLTQTRPQPTPQPAAPPAQLTAPVSKLSAQLPTPAKPQSTPFSMIPVGKIPTVNSSSNDDAERAPRASANFILASNTYDTASQIDEPVNEIRRPTAGFEKLSPQVEPDTQLYFALQRRKMLASELRQEETLVRDIRQTLSKEEAESASYRAKTQELAKATKKNTAPSSVHIDAKAALLAHFERKRLLQDTLATHERTADALREVLRAR